MQLRRILTLFLSAFVLNAAWENVHSLLYLHYRGGPISEFILLRATLMDALIIVVLALPFIFFLRLQQQLWLFAAALLVVAIGIEWWALATSRWAYGPLMPVLPLLGTGLTPTVQLALLGVLSFKFSARVLA